MIREGNGNALFFCGELTCSLARIVSDEYGN